MRIPVGTRSLLVGVHAIWYHPVVVVRAWCYLHRRLPTIDEAICIFVHDWGYLGCENMDGAEGRRHPERGARIARELVYWRNRLFGRTWIDSVDASIKAFNLTIYHSSNYAREHAMPTSALFLPDKCSILFEPRWFYLLRAKLSGEIAEYIASSPLAKLPPELRTPGAWHNWYCRKVRNKLFWMPEIEWRRMRL